MGALAPPTLWLSASSLEVLTARLAPPTARRGIPAPVAVRLSGAEALRVLAYRPYRNWNYWAVMLPVCGAPLLDVAGASPIPASSTGHDDGGSPLAARLANVAAGSSAMAGGGPRRQLLLGAARGSDGPRGRGRPGAGVLFRYRPRGGSHYRLLLSQAEAAGAANGPLGRHLGARHHPRADRPDRRAASSRRAMKLAGQASGLGPSGAVRSSGPGGPRRSGVVAVRPGRHRTGRRPPSCLCSGFAALVGLARWHGGATRVEPLLTRAPPRLRLAGNWPYPGRARSSLFPDSGLACSRPFTR